MQSPLYRSLMGNGFRFSNPRSQFQLDKQNRIKMDPETGRRIQGKDRVGLKKFLQNPYGINAGNAVSLNMPEAPDLRSLLFGGTNPLEGLF